MAFQPPPTWALPILVDEKTKLAIFNPVWLKWFVDLVSVLNSVGTGGTSVNHNTLTGLQGGGTSQYYHLTSATYTDLTAGFTGTNKLVRETNPTLSAVTVTGAFGCNGASQQTAYASGGAAPAGGVGTAAGGWDTAAHRDSAITLLNNIRSALVANGIMS